MRLLGLAYTQQQGHLRRFLNENYAVTYSPLYWLFKNGPPKLIQRRDLLANSLRHWFGCFTRCSSLEVLRNMARALDTGKDASVEEVMQLFNSVLGSRLRARILIPKIPAKAGIPLLLQVD